MKEFVLDERMHTKAVFARARNDLRYAVERNEFELHYQPIVNLQNLQLCGFEALVRWNHPTFGQIAPDRFIPVAESTGLIIPMTVSILETACRQTVEWQRLFKGAAPRFISVNISDPFRESAPCRSDKEVLEKRV